MKLSNYLDGSSTEYSRDDRGPADRKNQTSQDDFHGRRRRNLQGAMELSRNSPLVYTSETLSLALLDLVAQVPEMDLLIRKFIKILVSFDEALVYIFPRKKLPKNWDHLRLPWKPLKESAINGFKKENRPF